MIDISFEDRVVDLVEEGYDLALRVASDSLAPGLSHGRCGARRSRSRHRPNTSGVMVSQKFLRTSSTTTAQVATYSTPGTSGPEGERDVPVRVVMRFRSNAALARAHAVALGTCLSPLPPPYFADPAFNGRLGVVLPDYWAPGRCMLCM